MKEILKIHGFTICLTAVTIVDTVYSEGIGATFLLWVGYGIYKYDKYMSS
jgi:hypothetical protein